LAAHENLCRSSLLDVVPRGYREEFLAGKGDLFSHEYVHGVASSVSPPLCAPRSLYDLRPTVAHHISPFGCRRLAIFGLEGFALVVPVFATPRPALSIVRFIVVTLRRRAKQKF